ncbi:MAG: GTP 3',8-cyclase MoaA [Pseudomonadota bacterium]
MTVPSPLRDRFGRAVTYLRLSVTDRCDLRCGYCMAEKMKFLPKRDLLTLEELSDLSDAFIARGVRKVRITGGEPLVRRDMMVLMKRLSRHLESGRLRELTLTTNATQLASYAADLKAMGVERINVSLDTLCDQTFERLTRRHVLSDVLRGIDVAQKVGIHIKINTVALAGVNRNEIPETVAWAHGRGMDATLIEVMPLGEIAEDRIDQFLPLSAVRADLEERWTLTPVDRSTGGPARYWRVAETGGDLGFITPLTNNFCAGCNRVRVTCTGRVYGCLGHDDYVDFRAALRGAPADLAEALDRVMARKPERHHFEIARRGDAPTVARHMSVTGG